MRHIIIGTAGHVDHGKTTLIRALTGVETDRLKEEQERGMTIDLGFASLALPDGSRAGVVDVPGHERFIKNMLAGATGIDLVMLVIAADESVMPQTIEHLDILQLLEVKRGVVVLTKADTVEPDWLAAVDEDVRKQLQGTFLANAVFVPVDSERGTGIKKLKQVLWDEIQRVPARNIHAPFRLPIDRVFTRSGFGTVVTGTLVSGTLRVGDSVELHPTFQKAKVRGLQSFHKKLQETECGTRVAVNLQGVDVEDISRGMVVTCPGTLHPTEKLDVSLTLLQKAAKPLRDRARVRLHLGSAEIIARVRLLEGNLLEPGASCFAQLRCESVPAACRGDRFVVRTYSPATTIGGGTILNAAPTRHRRKDPNVISSLRARQSGTPINLVESLLQSSVTGERVGSLATKLDLSLIEIMNAIKALIADDIVVILDADRALSTGILSTHEARTVAALSAYHSQHPASAGLPREELRNYLGPNIDVRFFNSLLKRWSESGIVIVDGAAIRLPGFEASLNAPQTLIKNRMLEVYKTAGASPPSVSEVVEALNCSPEDIIAILQLSARNGDLIKLDDNFYMHIDAWDTAVALIRQNILANGPITVSQFRDLAGTSRKFALPILERMDAMKITIRNGDVRELLV